MRQAGLREILCKTALNRVRGMPFEWSLNPFSGCAHACVYCYAREYFALKDRDPARGFESQIEVKVNFPEVLRAELRRGVSGVVALGTATDPYQPCEGKYRITRRALEAIRDYPVPLGIVTKNPMVVRDADLLAAIAARNGGDLRVHFSISTMDDRLWRQVEPGTAPPLKRLDAMRRLRGAGIKAGVLNAPVLAGLADREEDIHAVARAAREHGAYSFHWRPLKLDPHVKEVYLSFVAMAFPALLPRYVERYANGPQVDPAYLAALEARVRRVRARYEFPEDREDRGPARAPRSAPRPRQLALAI